MTFLSYDDYVLVQAVSGSISNRGSIRVSYLSSIVTLLSVYLDQAEPFLLLCLLRSHQKLSSSTPTMKRSHCLREISKIWGLSASLSQDAGLIANLETISCALQSFSIVYCYIHRPICHLRPLLNLCRTDFIFAILCIPYAEQDWLVFSIAHAASLPCSSTVTLSVWWACVSVQRGASWKERLCSNHLCGWICGSLVQQVASGPRQASAWIGNPHSVQHCSQFADWERCWRWRKLSLSCYS